MKPLILVVDDEPDVEVLFRQQFRRDLRVDRFIMEFALSAPAALQLRMESHSLPGRIQLSAATRAALGNSFMLERRGIIEVKGKGMMETYFLNGR